MWGSGGFLADEGESTIGGQFGEIEFRSPLIVDMVADLSSDPGKWTPAQIAERLVHENFHSQDFLDGASQNHQGHDHGNHSRSWTEGNDHHQTGIFAACDGMRDRNATGDEREFQSCYNNRPELFNFRPNYPYSATTGYEYYASMRNQWIRDARNGTQVVFACRNQETRELWFSMEEQLLGERVTQCP